MNTKGEYQADRLLHLTHSPTGHMSMKPEGRNANGTPPAQLASELSSLSFALVPARLYKCNDQVFPNTLTLFEVHVSTIFKFQICANAFRP